MKKYENNTKIALLIFSIILSAILLSKTVYADPLIGSISGAIDDGLEITVYGMEFGDIGPRIVIFDDFEGGRQGDPIKTGLTSAKIGGWSTTEGTVRYSSLSSHSGQLSFQADMSGGWRNLAEVILPDSGNPQVFISWWLFIPGNDYYPGENVNSTNWKQLWIQGDGTTDDDLVFPTFNGFSSYFFGNDSCIDNRGSMYIKNWNFNKGQWHRYWGFVKGLPNSTGAIYLYELDPDYGYSALCERTNVTVQCNTGDLFERVHINGYGRQTPNSHPMYDDVYIAVGDSARARIEIGDNADYKLSKKLAISTVTNWKNNEIKAIVRQGAFSAGERAFLFVFDNDGIVNSVGFPVLFGEESGGLKTINAPTGLDVTQLPGYPN